MQNYSIEIFKLILEDKENKTCSIKLVSKTATSLALVDERRKIYIVSTDKEVLYVGEANTSIKTRLRRGCTAYNYYVSNDHKARRGYKGYKWLNKDENPVRILNLTCVVFNTKFNDKRTIIEAIEGELVYRIRNQSGNWPAFQSEIHFSNYPSALKVAESIFKDVL